MALLEIASGALTLFGIFGKSSAAKYNAEIARRNALTQQFNAKNAMEMAKLNSAIEGVNQQNRELAEEYNVRIREQEQDISEQFYRHRRAQHLFQERHQVGKGLRNVRKTEGTIAVNGNLSPDVLRSVVAEQMTEIDFFYTSSQAALREMDFQQEVGRAGYSIAQRSAGFQSRISAQASSLRQQGILAEGASQQTAFEQSALDSQNRADNFRMQGHAALIQGAASLMSTAYRQDWFGWGSSTPETPATTTTIS